ncbi:MAG: PspC domain-containing protein [Prevotella sp.]|nr:PspC domain-containing protein [Prevotella sp.]
MNKRLTRSATDKMLCGVCGGIAEYLDVDPTIIRVAYVVMSLFSVAFPGLILYIVLALIIPQKGY